MRRRVILLLGAGFVLLPLLGLLGEVDWANLSSTLEDPATTQALRTSVIVSFAATLISLALGIPIGIALSDDGPLSDLSRPILLAPLLLPPVLSGSALLFTFGRNGIVGRYLEDWFGVVLPFHTSGAILAATFVATPFVVLAVESGARSSDPRVSDAAATLGSGGLDRLMRIRLPLLLPQIAIGAIAAWARAVGEFGATITFAGNVEGATRTLPLDLVTSIQGGDTTRSTTVGVVLLVLGVVVLWASRSGWNPARAFEATRP